MARLMADQIIKGTILSIRGEIANLKVALTSSITRGALVGSYYLSSYSVSGIGRRKSRKKKLEATQKAVTTL